MQRSPKAEAPPHHIRSMYYMYLQHVYQLKIQHQRSLRLRISQLHNPRRSHRIEERPLYVVAEFNPQIVNNNVMSSTSTTMNHVDNNQTLQMTDTRSANV